MLGEMLKEVRLRAAQDRKLGICPLALIQVLTEGAYTSEQQIELTFDRIGSRA